LSGDWVHLNNPNDVTKPIVAQIYRTWQDPEGHKWINACWYYRPEQTVHRYEKHFFENEVVKTGQYRDHQIDEVQDRCFVMFFTRYNKGRPRGFPADKEVYVCEARYNEEKHKLNKIKTWASCVPDEVREKDYEMDLFDHPRKMKKVPSPIKHLLREDAKEDDPLPKPTWGAKNAPPIVGAVHKRPREENVSSHSLPHNHCSKLLSSYISLNLSPRLTNVPLQESPPPEPTPSPPPQPPPTERRQSSVVSSRPYDNQPSTMSSNPYVRTSASPATSTAHLPSASYGQQLPTAQQRPSASPAPLQHQSSYNSAHSSNAPQTPHSNYNSASYNQYANVPPPPHTQPAPTPAANTYDNYRPGTGASSSRPSLPAGNAYNPPRPNEVFHLSDTANASIPFDIRQQFKVDEHGRVLFFTTPPIETTVKTDLAHSIEYLAEKSRRKEMIARKRKQILDQQAEAAKHAAKRQKEIFDEQLTEAAELLHMGLQIYVRDYEEGTNQIYKELYGDDWQEMRAKRDAQTLQAQKQFQEEQATEEKRIEAKRIRDSTWRGWEKSEDC
jgi:chromatin structure-remodeling complex subunit RSC1/2